jgi:Tol biopolymer transport system component
MLAAAAAAQPPVFLNINPSWSPDGRQLAFESQRSGRIAIYVINADGSGERQLTHNVADDTHPAWSPDGSTILFDSNRDGVWNLYTIHPDGTGERRLAYPETTGPLTFARHLTNLRFCICAPQ